MFRDGAGSKRNRRVTSDPSIEINNTYSTVSPPDRTEEQSTETTDFTKKLKGNFS